LSSSDKALSEQMEQIVLEVRGAKDAHGTNQKGGKDRVIDSPTRTNPPLNERRCPKTTHLAPPV
jgi:hypothetical protein